MEPLIRTNIEYMEPEWTLINSVRRDIHFSPALRKSAGRKIVALQLVQRIGEPAVGWVRTGWRYCTQCRPPR
jgi:hypothetical protein